MLADLCLDLWNIFGSALVYSVSIVGGAAAIALVIEHYNGGPRWERRETDE